MIPSNEYPHNIRPTLTTLSCSNRSVYVPLYPGPFQLSAEKLGTFRVPASPLPFISLVVRDFLFGFVWKCCVPLKTQWFCWSLSLLNGYFIGNIPHFQTYLFANGSSQSVLGHESKNSEFEQRHLRFRHQHVSRKKKYQVNGVPSENPIFQIRFFV